MKAEFKGGRELEAALKSLGFTTSRKRGIATRALREAAEPIREEWANGVDVNSGDLKKSIKVGNRASTKQSRAFRRGKGSAMVEQYVGIDASEGKDLPIYAPIEEFGNEGHPANPAGRRAWEAQKVPAAESLNGAMWAEIERTAKRAAARTARLKK